MLAGEMNEYWTLDFPVVSVAVIDAMSSKLGAAQCTDSMIGC